MKISTLDGLPGCPTAALSFDLLKFGRGFWRYDIAVKRIDAANAKAWLAITLKIDPRNMSALKRSIDRATDAEIKEIAAAHAALMGLGGAKSTLVQAAALTPSIQDLARDNWGWE